MGPIIEFGADPRQRPYRQLSATSRHRARDRSCMKLTTHAAANAPLSKHGRHRTISRLNDSGKQMLASRRSNLLASRHPKTWFKPFIHPARICAKTIDDNRCRLIGHCRHWGGQSSASATWRIADDGGIEQPDGSFLHRRTHTPDPLPPLDASSSNGQLSKAQRSSVPPRLPACSRSVPTVADCWTRPTRTLPRMFAPDRRSWFVAPRPFIRLHAGAISVAHLATIVRRPNRHRT
jgi:hypothetical protein